jgi:hypothetical protein
MIKKITIVASISVLLLAAACKTSAIKMKTEKKESVNQNKEVVYQVFTRLFGNTNTTNKPWGTIEENGVGKFNDINKKALQELKKLGVNYVWYTVVCIAVD